MDGSLSAGSGLGIERKERRDSVALNERGGGGFRDSTKGSGGGVDPCIDYILNVSDIHHSMKTN